MLIHHAPNTRSVRAVWLFEELGLPYDLKVYKLGDPAMRSPEYLKLHPLGRVPALEDGDCTIFESGAIVEYVLARYGEGRLRPAPDAPEFPAYLQWLHYAEGMMMPQVNVIVVETRFAGGFSGADIMTGHACIAAGRLEADLSDKPHVAAYIGRLTGRPAYRRAMQAA